MSVVLRSKLDQMVRRRTGGWIDVRFFTVGIIDDETMSCNDVSDSDDEGNSFPKCHTNSIIRAICKMPGHLAASLNSPLSHSLNIVSAPENLIHRETNML